MKNLHKNIFRTKIKKPKIFIQINIGDEQQKSGIHPDKLKEFFSLCKNLDLDIQGLMWHFVNSDPIPFFKKMKTLNTDLNLSHLSMGMSSDYIQAANNFSTLSE